MLKAPITVRHPSDSNSLLTDDNRNTLPRIIDVYLAHRIGSVTRSDASNRCASNVPIPGPGYETLERSHANNRTELKFDIPPGKQ